MERRVGEKEWYVVYKDDRDRLWQATMVIGKTPNTFDPQTIVGTLPKMTTKDLCNLFGVVYNETYHQRAHIETQINRKIRDSAFYGAEAKANLISLRAAMSTRYCPVCNRNLVMAQGKMTPFQCLFCNKTMKASETITKKD